MSHPEFELIRTQQIDSLAVEAQEYVHRQTGARHLHFASNNDENVFLVGLKTVPTDNSGVAHILEHTALCGSEKYPVRDPFFMMIRRSLNTFMNAFTSSDWTAYPFASKNKKDFNNLLDVYLDAVFFSRLDEMDFLQEGHRVEFEEENNAESPLVYKGVVYNEMKGAMSSPVSQLWQMLTRHVFPTSTYHYNSGGDPEHITDLSYDELKAFYAKHYHPSNAVFMTFGDIPAEQHQQTFHNNVLSRFERSEDLAHVTDEKRYCAPITVVENYPLDKADSTENKTHIVLSWLLGHSFDLESNLEAHLLSNVLFENSAAPLQKALEQTELGHAPSPLCGLEDSNKEMLFACGVEGSEPEKAAEFEQLVISVLEDVAENGVPQERLEAVLHQLELSQREISGDSYPYGLQLILAGLSPMLHGGDPVALLDLDPVLERLREQIKEPDYIQSRVKRLLLDNAHRVTLVMKPDHGYDEVRTQLVEAELAAKKAALSNEELQQVGDKAKALKERQEAKDDESILPKVGIEDVPTELIRPTGKRLDGTVHVTEYNQGTNGLVYQQAIYELPALTDKEQALLPLYTSIVTELGVGQESYLDLQNRQSAATGGIHAYTSVKGGIDDVQQVQGILVFAGKALRRNSQELNSLLHDYIQSVRFDETSRMRELVAQMRARREQAVVNSGHSLAMGAAASNMSPAANFGFRLGGLQGIKAIKALDDSLNDDQALSDLASSLEEIHRKVVAMPCQYLIVGERDSLDEMHAQISAVAQASTQTSGAPFTLPTLRKGTRQGWITNTQVNFCAKAFPTVPVEHPDAPALTVLGGFLRNGYLHRSIREQGGAYGGGASQDSASASFRFFSYRDPRLSETLDDFDASVKWLLEAEHDEEQLEQAVLGVVSQIDKPRSPAGEAKGDFHSELFGRSQAQRDRFRQAILQVNLDDLKRVAAEYLKPEVESVAVISSVANETLLRDLDLEISEV